MTRHNGKRGTGNTSMFLSYFTFKSATLYLQIKEQYLEYWW